MISRMKRITPRFEEAIFERLAEVVQENRSIVSRVGCFWRREKIRHKILRVFLFDAGYPTDQIPDEGDRQYMGWLVRTINNRGRSILEKDSGYVYVYGEGTSFAATILEKSVYIRPSKNDALERVLEII